MQVKFKACDLEQIKPFGADKTFTTRWLGSRVQSRGCRSRVKYSKDVPLLFQYF